MRVVSQGDPRRRRVFRRGGTKLNPAGKRMVEGQEGTLTALRAPDGHDIIVIVTSKNSKARKEGHDVFFQTCSEECSAKVSAALRT